MSSMVQDAYDMGITTSLGGMPRDSFYRDTPRRSYRNNTTTQRSTFESTPEKFDTAIEAQEYAKRNPGVVITRANDGTGYIIK